MSHAKNIREVEIKIEKDEWKKYLDKAFNKVKNEVKVDGFRKGKVTREIFNKKVGVQALFEDAINYAIDDEYKKIMDNDKYEPIVRPTVDIVDINENDATIKFTITTKPEIKLGDYKNLGIKKEKVSVSKKEFEDEIENLRRDYAEIIVKDGKAENKDTVVIDFDGYLNGEPFDGGKSENYPLELGSNTFIPGFEDQIVGMKKGEEKDIIVTFPEDYPAENLKGKEVIFKVKVNEVKTKQLPELEKEFFEDLGYDEINTADEFKEHIKDNIKNEKTNKVENKYVDDLLDKLVETSSIESVPDEFVNNEIERMYYNASENIKMQGINMETYLKFINKTEEEVKESFKDDALKRVKVRILLEEIVEIEKLKVEEKELEERLQKLSELYEMTKEEVINAFGGKEVVKYDALMNKALKILQDQEKKETTDKK